MVLPFKKSCCVTSFGGTSARKGGGEVLFKVWPFVAIEPCQT